MQRETTVLVVQRDNAFQRDQDRRQMQAQQQGTTETLKQFGNLAAVGVKSLLGGGDEAGGAR